MATVDDRTPTSVRARLDYTEANIANAFGQYEVQLASVRRAIERYRLAGDSVGIAFAKSRETQALSCLGRFSEAKFHLQEALSLARALGNRWLIGFVLRGFADASVEDHDLVAARGYVAEALECYDPVGAKLDVALIMLELCEIELAAGNADLALRHATEALITLRAGNQLRVAIISLSCVIKCLISLNDYGEAETNAREMLDLACEHHLGGLTTEALLHLGAIAALRPQRIAAPQAARYAKAARILGFVDSRLAAMGSTNHRDDRWERSGPCRAPQRAGSRGPGVSHGRRRHDDGRAGRRASAKRFTVMICGLDVPLPGIPPTDWTEAVVVQVGRAHNDGVPPKQGNVRHLRPN